MDTWQTKIYEWPVSTWRTFEHISQHRKYILDHNEIPLQTTQWLRLKRLTTPHVVEDVERLQLSHCWWGCKMVHLLETKIWQFPLKLNIQLPMTKTALLSIDLIEMKVYVHKKTCSRMFIAASFVIVVTWKEHRCPSIENR